MPVSALFARNAGIFAKQEVTYKTDPIPTGIDAVLVSNLSVQPYAGNRVSRDFIRPYLGGSSEINTGPYVEISFDVELAGGGGADIPPPWSALVQACMWVETVNATIDVTFNLTSTGSAMESVTIYYENNGETQVVVGCLGNMSLNLSAGTIPKISFRFMGIYAKPSASSITPDFSAYQVPLPINDSNTGTLTIDSYAFRVSDLTIDLNNQVTYRNVVNYEYVVASDRDVTGSITFEAPLIATKDVYALVESHNGISLPTFDWVHGATAGNIIELDAPNMQLTDIQEGESDDVKTYTCPFKFVPSSSGNDELVLITK